MPVKEFPLQGRYGKGVVAWELPLGVTLAGMTIGKGTANVTIHLLKAAAKSARLDEAERERIVAMMWDLVYADGTVHEFEDNLIWRVAELLAVPTRARMRLKQAARANAGQ